VIARAELVGSLAATLVAVHPDRVALVGVDGVDGAGKTTLADELAETVTAQGRPVIRASIDGFHHPRAHRYRRGRDCARGFYEDSFDTERLRAVLLDPLRRTPPKPYRTEWFDHRTDRPVIRDWRQARGDELLLVDGVFLQSPALTGAWDLVVFVDVTTETSVHRCALRDGSPDDPHDEAVQRYVQGQALYLSEREPQSHADAVWRNDDLDHPQLIWRR
jgi:uridine kinase